MNLNGVISDHPARGKQGAPITIVERIGSAPRDESMRMSCCKIKEMED